MATKNYTGKTKLEMITEVINATNWSSSSKEKNIKRAYRTKTLDLVLKAYYYYKDSPERALFFATVLSN